jgi:tetratricopeptide (TPR) repeat protein
MKIDPELFSGLMEIAFIAKGKGYLHEAESIFEFASIFKPHSAYPCIGKAEVLMHKGMLEKAVVILRNAPMQDFKERELCHCYLGKALKLSGYYEEAQKILKEITDNGTYDIAKEYAQELYGTDLLAFFG